MSWKYAIDPTVYSVTATIGSSALLLALIFVCICRKKQRTSQSAEEMKSVEIHSNKTDTVDNSTRVLLMEEYVAPIDDAASIQFFLAKEMFDTTNPLGSEMSIKLSEARRGTDFASNSFINCVPILQTEMSDKEIESLKLVSIKGPEIDQQVWAMRMACKRNKMNASVSSERRLPSEQDIRPNTEKLKLYAEEQKRKRQATTKVAPKLQKKSAAWYSKRISRERQMKKESLKMELNREQSEIIPYNPLHLFL